MTLYLTSSPTGPLDGSRKVMGFDEMNGFRASLARRWKPDSRCLMVAASPNAYTQNDEMRAFFENALTVSGLSVSHFELWDARIPTLSRETLLTYDGILLGGGHVPTMQAFLTRIGLKEKLIGFEGIVIGISAGTMCAASTIYAQPEESGEAIDPEYRRFLSGLALTDTMVLPHYQMVKNWHLDGMRLYEDITYPDSFGNTFIALTDGAFILCENGAETVFGESYLIRNGVIRPLATTGGYHILKS